MPPTTKKAGPKTGSRTTTETLASDARRPPGAPALLPFHALGRRAKADFTAALAKIDDGSALLDVREETAGRTANAAKLLSLVADVEDGLAVTAAEPEKFRAWARDASDDDLFRLFNWYSSRMGEASASPS